MCKSILSRACMSKRLTFGASLQHFAYSKNKNTENDATPLLTAKSLEIAPPVEDADPSPARASPKRKAPQSLSPPPAKDSKRKKLVYTGGSLQPLAPLLRPGLRCVFVGFNPGTMSAIKGHYYAHHSNQFWKMLYQSGCVDEPVTYVDDQSCPDRFNLGFTDLVLRSTAGVTDLSSQEMHEAVPQLELRIQSATEPVLPHVICLVGKGIWDAIAKFKKFRKRGPAAPFTYGLQPETFAGTHIYVVPSTSGLAASIPRDVKFKLWQGLAAYLDS